jgi:hypothetical protein
MPEADVEVRRLLKSTQLARKDPAMPLIDAVLKTDYDAGLRYQRFFGLPCEKVFQDGIARWAKKPLHDYCRESTTTGNLPGPLVRQGWPSPRGTAWLCHTKSVSKNLSRTAHVALPVAVAADIDRLVGKRSRSAFLTELAQREIKIRRQREAAGAWKSEDHPELAQGAAAWVRQIRALDNQRFEELERRRDGK